MADINRSLPNILITGTPGVGKSLLSRILCRKTGLTCIEVSDFAIEKGCLEEYDEVYECPVLDEEKLLDEMEDLMCKGGMVVDYHGCDFFPQDWFDIVFVLRTDNTILYDRLKERGYTGKKLEDNIQCEIFQIILEQATTTFEKEIVHELTSDDINQLTDNVNRICQWIEQWKLDNKEE
ncbi:adenylate kinase isoenzyme 6 [Bombus pyrosoma]|uniref:adenylate kinase isoenzyme 6 n=1 Tax=Bombus pyrosoma TaxID=396416 RepID=UPI001CB924AE|nr:adenylate kinase isoenzyme 6 [Bombus pyrosoma]XP_043590957.1 adenylate kinase isoenzyme 6 [Bombus pyrosoma]